MKKFLTCLLFAFTLLFSANITAYAAGEDYTYSEYVDEVAGIEKPYWSFDYYPELSFEHKFLFIEWGKAETVAWNIDTVSFYFTLINEHKGKFDVGYLPSDMDITFNYVYSSVDEYLNHYKSSASFVYSLADIDTSTDYVEFVFPYEEVLAGSEYYEQGFDTVIKSVEVVISSRVLKTHGTYAHYEFYADDNYANQIYTGIDYYMMTDEDMLVISTRAESFKDPEDTIDLGGVEGGNGGEIEKHHFVVVYSDSYQEDIFDLNETIEKIAIELPRAMVDVAEFLTKFIVSLPEYICSVFPFLPGFIVYGIMFCIVFIVSAKLVFRLGGSILKLFSK
ncbi:MAG: hypothetical protein IJW75_04900 [Alphaproteobacteria bacterium]|nr:hypothetical protein [Alphaproteobacteria bacterium]